MRVKVGDKYIDPSIDPIMIVFDNDADRNRLVKHLQNMPDGNFKYCSFPATMTIKDVDIFMEIAPTKPDVRVK